IRAGQNQNQHNRGHQQQQPRPDDILLDAILLKRHDVRAPAFLGRGIHFLRAASQPAHVRSRSLEISAPLQSAEKPDVARVTRIWFGSWEASTRGVHRRGRKATCRNDAGSTPITTYFSPSSVTVFPMISGSEANRRRQRL